jgi:hypothetical protein
MSRLGKFEGGGIGYVRGGTGGGYLDSSQNNSIHVSRRRVYNAQLLPELALPPSRQALSRVRICAAQLRLAFGLAGT